MIKVPRVLVGNKIDCPNRRVQKEDAEKFAKSKKMDYFESSAKLNEGVYQIFHKLAELGLAKKGVDSNSAKNENRVELDQKIKKKKKSCC